MTAPKKALFSEYATETLEQVQKTFEERGSSYGDTWRDCQWLALKATAKQLDVTLPEAAIRALAAAVMVDIKYARLMGGYKEDSPVDGIAYQALWVGEMKRSAKEGK